MADHNIIYADISAGIIICQEINSSISSMNKHNAYPIVICRNYMNKKGTTRFATIRPMPTHPWQHKIITETFEKIGWPVKVTTNGKYYSLKNKKDRFRFKLKYGA